MGIDQSISQWGYVRFYIHFRNSISTIIQLDHNTLGIEKVNINVLKQLTQFLKNIYTLYFMIFQKKFNKYNFYKKA